MTGISENCDGLLKYGDLVGYTHYLPILILIIVLIYCLKLHRGNILLMNLLYFILGFLLWLILDIVTWTTTNIFHLIAAWTPMDLIEVIFTLCLIHFYILYVNKSYSSKKIVLLFLILVTPLFLMTVTGNTVVDFDITNCEVISSKISTNYKLIVELLGVLTVIILFITPRCRFTKIDKVDVTITSLLLIFLITFSVSEYVSSMTGIYEIHLYSLLIVPVFIVISVYCIVNYRLPSLKEMIKSFLLIVIVLFSTIPLLGSGNTSIILYANIIFTVIICILIIHINSREALHLSQISSLATSLKDLNDNLEEKVALQTAKIKKSYELEQNAHRELVKLSEAKDSFISIAQHNLRIPITNINNKIENLIKNSQHLDDTAKKTLINTKESLDNLNEIADEFRNISKIKRGAQILQPTRETLLPIVLGILSELTFEIERLNIKINYPTLPESWPQLNIDKNKIKDALIVVIENAIKYNTNNGHITISNKTINNNFIMKIENSGLGLSEQEKENLDKHSFYRSERVKNINPVGMGIGLYLAKSIIEAHHGKLIISSNGEDLGATVEITIPLDFLNHN